jgi:hypothetical protein
MLAMPHGQLRNEQSRDLEVHLLGDPLAEPINPYW